MNRKIFKFVSAGIVAATFLAVGFASPASADTVNTLPSGNSLYVVDAQGDGGIYETTAAGEMTKLTLQIPDIGDGFYPAGALSPVDNYAYLVLVANDACAIDKIDLLGGAPAARVPVVSAHPVTDCYGLNIAADGTALIYGSYTESGTTTDAIWSIDLTTGVLTNEVDVPGQMFGFTVNPAGDWFGLTSDGHLQGIDKVTGQFTELVNHELYDAYDCKFDSAGTLWFTDNETDAAPFQLYSWRVGDTDYTLQGDTTVNGLSADGTYGPTFVGNSTPIIADVRAAEAKLPNTGGGFGALWLGLGLLVTAGGVLAIRHRVRLVR